MNEKQRDIEVGKLVLRVIPGFGEQVVLVDPHGVEIGTEVIGWDMDGYDVAARDAFVYLIRQNLPEISDPNAAPPSPSYRRALVAPAELERGTIVEIGDTGSVLGEVADRDVLGSLDTLVTGRWADGRTFAFPVDKGLWVRIPN